MIKIFVYFLTHFINQMINLILNLYIKDSNIILDLIIKKQIEIFSSFHTA